MYLAANDVLPASLLFVDLTLLYFTWFVLIQCCSSSAVTMQAHTQRPTRSTPILLLLLQLLL
jgi:hypothetical protein